MQVLALSTIIHRFHLKCGWNETRKQDTERSDVSFLVFFLVLKNEEYSSNSAIRCFGLNVKAYKILLHHLKRVAETS